MNSLVLLIIQKDFCKAINLKIVGNIYQHIICVAEDACHIDIFKKLIAPSSAKQLFLSYCHDDISFHTVFSITCFLFYHRS